MAEIKFPHRPENERETPLPNLQSDESAPEVVDFFESLHPAISRVLIYVILGFVTAGLLWAGFGHVDVVATASFRLIPLGKMKTIQASREGQIEEILVQEGGRVVKDQVLFKLKSEETWQDIRALEQARVTYQKAEYDFAVALPKKQQLLNETIATLKDRLAMMEAFIETQNTVLLTYQKNLDKTQYDTDESTAHALARVNLESEIQIRMAELEHLKKRYNEHLVLYEKRLISRSALDELRVQYFDTLAKLPERMTEIHRLWASAQELKREILEAQIQKERESSALKHALEAARLQYEQAQQKTERSLDAHFDLILASENGVVTYVAVNAIGQVVRRGEVLANVAPSSSPMVAEVLIQNKDIGLVQVGQPVKLKYEAFPFERYGVQRGQLTQISPDALHDPDMGFVYRTTVNLESTEIRAGSQTRSLKYGMKGTAEIVTDRVSVLSLLLKPLRRFQESVSFQIEEKAN